MACIEHFDVDPIAFWRSPRAQKPVEKRRQRQLRRNLGRHQIGHGFVDDFEHLQRLHRHHRLDDFAHQIGHRRNLPRYKRLLRLAIEERRASRHEFALQNRMRFDAILDGGIDARHRYRLGRPRHKRLEPLTRRYDNIALDI